METLKNSLKTGKKGISPNCEVMRVYNYYLSHTATMLRCSRDLGIDRANICRYIARMRANDMIQLRFVDVDEITGRKSGYFCAVENDCN